MRELKFKAWNESTKTMWWFDLMWGDMTFGKGFIGMLPIGETEKSLGARDFRTAVEPHECIMLQFTGLTDKNGEMWESDLYELLLNGIETHTELVLYEIRWNDKVAGFGFFKITKDSEQPEWIGLSNESILDKEYKGNIHQDKKLLK